MTKSAIAQSPDLATAFEPSHADESKTRHCLRCKSEFLSSWSGERICGRCKGSTAWRNGTPYSFTSAGRRV
ncbi:hypothetical protein [Oceanibacterium hippocampi]|uniref:hypothetical protein n=1 Tax=Oceanibacterium hippocampi TaxID=745714 RepID=UPI00111C18D1|nr:hypothetical protein [Oceanibacterium hippocampi]